MDKCQGAKEILTMNKAQRNCLICRIEARARDWKGTDGRPDQPCIVLFFF